ncbi:beta strand repeat-containing protein [Indioceanicola profundi]|uniref:beta strand repeat-containing protein n=1 Tax=Indioceanicola profundi TaxID=2220096 RepID=UPI000E6AA9DD|nr:hypothetical protein [Indioceanicola profundi]
MKRTLLAGVSGVALAAALTTAPHALAAPAQNTVKIGGPNNAAAVVDSRSESVQVRSENSLTRTGDAGEGLVTVQQNTGNANAVSAASGITAPASATGMDSKVEVYGAAAELDARSTGDTRANTGVDSMTGFKGAATVQQNAGDLNQIAAGTAVQAQTGTTEQATQTVRVAGQVGRGGSGAEAIDTDSQRGNFLTRFMDRAMGLLGLQQNTGNANVISSGTAVTAMGGAGAVEQNVRSESSVDLTNSADPITALGGQRVNSLQQSFGNAAGVMTVQQNSGDANAMGAAVAIAGSMDEESEGTAAQRVRAGGSTQGGYTNQEGGVRTSGIDGSFTGASGVMTVQQNSGSANAINAATGVQASGAGMKELDTSATADAIQVVPTLDHDAGTRPQTAARTTGISNGSFNGAAGIITVQQNNGDSNGLSAATAVSAGDRSGRDQARTKAASTGQVADAYTSDAGSVRRNAIDSSFNGAAGIITIQQNNGSSNSMGAATAVVGQVGSGGSLNQVADSGNNLSIAGFELMAEDSERTNGLSQAFNGAKGVITIQQNNGDANTVNTALSVTAGVGRGAAAESSQKAVTYTESTFNMVDQGVAYGVQDPQTLARTNGLDRSLNGAGGVAAVVQNNGSSNSIAATAAVQADIGGGANGSSVAEAMARTFENTLTTDVSAASRQPVRGNSLTDSLNGFEGVATVQQNNGDGNAMSTAMAVRMQEGPDGAVSTQRAQAGGIVGQHDVLDDYGSRRSNALKDAVNGTSGVLSAQQNNGNGNSMSQAIAVGASLGTGDARQTVRVDNEVTLLPAMDMGAHRENAVRDSLKETEGLMVLQQNNGDGNAMSVATAVSAGLRGNSGSASRMDVNNMVDTTMPADVDYPDDAYGPRTGRRGNSVDNGLAGSSGVAVLQQNNGSANAMGTGQAVRAGTAGGPVFDQDVNVASQALYGATMQMGSGTAHPADRANSLGTGTLDGFGGIAAVQQNNGDSNALGMAQSVLAGERSGRDLNQSLTLDGVAGGGGAEGWGDLGGDNGSSRSNALTAAGARASGVIAVQQNNGDGNAMSAGQVVAANQGRRNLDQSLDAAALVQGNSTQTVGGNRRNSLDRSLDEAEGLITAQQNNGDNSVMNAGSAVAAIGPDSVAATRGMIAQDVRTMGTVDSVTARQIDPGVRSNQLRDSADDASGIIALQQNNGSNAAMGLGMAVTAGTADNLARKVAQTARAGGEISNATAISEGTPAADTTRDNAVNSTAKRAKGIVSAQQNNGDNAVLSASAAVAAGRGVDPDGTVKSASRTSGSVADVEANGGQPGKRSNGIDEDSFGGAEGLVAAQQNNGDNSVLANSTAVTAIMAVPADQAGATLEASAKASASVSGAVASGGGDRANGLAGSFKDAGGILAVQQNSGDNSVMGAATTVTTAAGGAFGAIASVADVEATVADTSGVVSGDAATSNTVQQGAFASAKGVAVVHQNNGNNNAIQSAIVVTARH